MKIEVSGISSQDYVLECHCRQIKHMIFTLNSLQASEVHSFQLMLLEVNQSDLLHLDTDLISIAKVCDHSNIDTKMHRKDEFAIDAQANEIAKFDVKIKGYDMNTKPTLIDTSISIGNSIVELLELIDNVNDLDELNVM